MYRVDKISLQRVLRHQLSNHGMFLENNSCERKREKEKSLRLDYHISNTKVIQIN